MKTALTKIGNSKGIIIPAQFLKTCQLDHTVSLNIQDDTLIVSRPKQPRSGWDAAFAKANTQDNTMLMDETASNTFDAEEWTW